MWWGYVYRDSRQAIYRPTDGQPLSDSWGIVSNLAKPLAKCVRNLSADQSAKGNAYMKRNRRRGPYRCSDASKAPCQT